MDKLRKLEINFPAAREKDLLDDMQRRAVKPWSQQGVDTHGNRPRPENFYFHRAAVGEAPPCAVCIRRDKPGHWDISAIVPDRRGTISAAQHNEILQEFASHIAEPAAALVQGLTAVQLSEYRLADHFSPAAVDLLRSFCETSNQGDSGTQPLDQEKWIKFLLQAYDDGRHVPGDIFRNCLTSTGWWRADGISTLVGRYDFAMQLLEQSGRPSRAK